MSLAQLEAAIDQLVSSSTLSKYEKRTLQPSAKILNRIAAAFGIKSAQLWGEPPCHVESIAYRKRNKLGKREQKRIEACDFRTDKQNIWRTKMITRYIHVPTLALVTIITFFTIICFQSCRNSNEDNITESVLPSEIRATV